MHADINNITNRALKKGHNNEMTMQHQMQRTALTEINNGVRWHQWPCFVFWRTLQTLNFTSCVRNPHLSCIILLLQTFPQCFYAGSIECHLCSNCNSRKVQKIASSLQRDKKLRVNYQNPPSSQQQCEILQNVFWFSLTRGSSNQHYLLSCARLLLRKGEGKNTALHINKKGWDASLGAWL